MLQIDEELMNKILGMIDTGKSQGAKLVQGGGRVGEKGYFIAPTVFADVKDDMTIARDEVSNTILITCVNDQWLFVINESAYSPDLWTSTANFEIQSNK